MKTTNSKNYESPRSECIRLASEQVFLSASDSKWYNNGSNGDFDYGIASDDEWA